jgi:RNA polymerase subunit RPABC4/transcription elongation factor Spt4
VPELIKCKNCEKEVGENAKTCPYCGEKTVIKISVKTWFFLFFFLVVIYNIAEIDTFFAGSLSASARKQIAKPLVTIQNLTWLKSGLTSVMSVDLKIKNASLYTIKDLVIRCGYHDESGINIVSNTETINDLIKPKTSKMFKNIEMRIINSQAKKNGCTVSDFELIK